ERGDPRRAVVGGLLRATNASPRGGTGPCRRGARGRERARPRLLDRRRARVDRRRLPRRNPERRKCLMGAQAGVVAKGVRVREAARAGEQAPMRVISPAPREAWDRLLRSDPDALPTQAPVWLDCLCSLTGARNASRLYDFGGGRRLVLPLARRRRGPLATESSYPQAWGFGGLVGGVPRVDEVRSVL